MSTKSVLQKILKGLMQTEEKNKSIHEATERNKPCWNDRGSGGLTHSKLRKMAGVSTEVLIISLSINSFNSPIRRYRLEDCIKKSGTTHLLPPRNVPRDERQTLSQGGRMDYVITSNRSKKQAGASVLVSDKQTSNLMRKDKATSC